MSHPHKIRYVVELGAALWPDVGEGVAARPLTPADRVVLAQLMLDAYRGTIDSEDEILDDAVDEIDGWLADREQEGLVIDLKLHAGLRLAGV